MLVGHHPTHQLSLATWAALLVSFLWQLGWVFTGVLPHCNGHYATECASQLWLTSPLGCWILLVERWVVFRLLSHFHSLTDWLLIVSCSNTAMIWNGGISTKLASYLATLLGVFPGRSGDYATELASHLVTLVKSYPGCWIILLRRWVVLTHFHSLTKSLAYSVWTLAEASDIGLLHCPSSISNSYVTLLFILLLHWIRHSC